MQNFLTKSYAFFPATPHSCHLTHPGFNARRQRTLIKPCFGTVKMANCWKMGNKCFPYARAVKESNWYRQHKWHSCHPCLEFPKHKPFHHPPPSQRASVPCSTCGPWIKFLLRGFCSFSRTICASGNAVVGRTQRSSQSQRWKVQGP